MLLIPLTLVATAAPARAAEQPQIVAPYAVVISANTGQVLYNKDMNHPSAPASLTKLFTAALALDSAPLGQTMKVDSADLVGEASMGLQVGDQVSLKTLLYGMLLPSGNDAATTIAQNLGALPGDSPQQAVGRFVGRLNQMAQQLGMTGTHLLNPHGLDQSGHVSTPRDIAAVTMYALKNPEFRTIISTPVYTGDGFTVYQANRLLGSYPGLIGGKTGITDSAGYCLVEVAERGGQTIIAVVMKSTESAWYSDATALLDYGFAELAARPNDPARPTITLTAAAPSAAPKVTAASTASSDSGLRVDRVASGTAVVSPARAAASGGFSWRWPLAALLSMIIVLALILNYPLLLGVGGLLLHRRSATLSYATAPAGTSLDQLMRPARRATRRRNRDRRAAERTAAPSKTHDLDWLRSGMDEDRVQNPWDRTGLPTVARDMAPSDAPGTLSVTGARSERGRVVSMNDVESIATRAVRLASRGDYYGATNAFIRALRADADYDFTRCPGFWAMQPLGYVAAARAYLLLNRPSDARTLATVVRLSYGSSRDLERLLGQVLGEPVRA